MLLKRIGSRLITNTKNTVLYLKYLMRGNSEYGGTGKQIFFDINDPRLERYLYWLLKMFDLGGFRIAMRFDPWLLLNLRNHADWIYDVPSLRIVRSRPGDCELAITNRKSDAGTIFLDTNYFSNSKDPYGFDLPFSMHPAMYRSGLFETVRRLRNNRRNIRISYGGNLSRGYNNTELNTLFKKLNRHQITEMIEDNFGDEISNIFSEIDAERVFNLESARIAIVREPVLTFERWFDLLAASDFMIAPPGYAMPFSNNIIEAMSVGTIPVTQYPELFSPPLTEGENCLYFSDPESFCETVLKCLDAGDEEIQRMRRNVISYYDTHLDPIVVSRRLYDSRNDIKTLYLIAGHLSIMGLKNEGKWAE